MPATLTSFSRALSTLVTSAMRGVVTLTGHCKDNEVSGSGFLIGDGFIVTNHHVVESLEPPVDVVLHGDIRSIASIVGVDAWTDLALLRLQAPVAHHLRLRTAPARLGELCLALGSPLGVYRESVSLGVVSGLARDLPSEGGRPICDAVQTDCAINPGNSGGPLIDVSGRVLGVTRCVDVRGANLAFAVPAPTVRSVVAHLMAEGHVQRASLGITVKETSVDVSGKATRGLRVVAIEKPTRKGLLRGDLIVRVAGMRVREPSQIYTALGRDRIGTPTVIEIIRKGNRQTLMVTPGRLVEGR